jgi:hypothetical protein
MSTPVSFSLEEVAANSINYYERLVDASGLPYFNVVWAEPAEAAHDWPDFGDVMSRQLQAAVMLRHMTGRQVATESIWLRKALSFIDPVDGQMHRPETTYCKPVADWGDNALSLYALATAAIESGSSDLKATVNRMAEGMLARVKSNSIPPDGFAIKGLMVAARLLGCDAAYEAARLLVDRVVVHGRLFTPDNTFGKWGHMHGNLRTMVGAADYAMASGDPVVFSRMDALYRYVKSTGTRFGFLPEAIGRQGDIISCETCALMDFAGIGVTLANHGHPEYWGDMERLMRNHMVESQVRVKDWLKSDNLRQDTEQFTWREINERILGAWAGWTSPNHILAARETLNAHWGGPELKNKTRALQNCCGGSGVHALFILWKNASRYEEGVLSVNMHLDKLLPQAEIRCEQPYGGATRITLRQDCAVRLRIPEFTRAADMIVTVNEIEMQAVQVFGNYLELGALTAGDRIAVHYPLPVTSEEIAVSNPGFRQWRYRVTWKGDTVVRMEPLGNEVRTAYSDFDKSDVEVFYGAEGPGALYQREDMLADCQPMEASLHLDGGSLDFWKI